MRLATSFYGLAALALTFAWAGTASAQPFPAAQDTVDIAQGPPNTLFNAIAGDTTATGDRVNTDRVYRLARGARYLQVTSLSGDYPINVVAAKPTADAPNSKPPIIQPSSSDNGDFPETIANTTADQTWKGVYFLGATPTGSASFYLLRSSGGATVTFDNVTTEYVQGIVVQFDAAGGSFIARDSRFLNGVNTSQIYVGRIVYFTTAGTADTPSARQVIFENNTIATTGGFIFQGTRGGDGTEVEEFRFNHNTVFSTGNYAFLEEQWTDALLTNNLIINAVAYGETVANRTGQDPDRLLYGVFNVDTLRTGQPTAEADRQIGIVANANYRDPRFDAYYASTPAGDATKVEGEPFFNARTQSFFDADNNIVVSDLFTEAPGFTNPPDNVDDIIQFRMDILSTPVPAVPTNYAFDPDGSVNTVTWPVPVDMTYSNAAYQTAGLNGYPLGDLNWYPAQKAAWEAAGGSQADYDAAIAVINGDGGGADGEVVASAEAESVAITGNISVLSSGDRAPSDADASGGQYLYMEDTGTITWTFNVATAGDYTLRVRHQLPFDPKAQLLSINGEALIKDDNGSRYFFDGEIGVWKDEDIAVTLQAGENTFLIEKDFGYMYFDSFSVLSTMVTAEEDGPDEAFQVTSSFPNPTTGRAQVRVNLAEAAQVSVSVYDLLGRQVMTVAETTVAAGANQALEIDGSGLSDGTYLYRVEARQGGVLRTATGRLTVVR